MEFSSLQQENAVCNMESSPDHWLQVEECGAELGIVDCSISSSPPSSIILMDERQRKVVRPDEEQGVKCPRCDSTHTKFCYYNNYSLSQPRYFCKTCRRYWTKGGTLRNIPVGGASRKTKKPNNINTPMATHHHDLDQHVTTTSFFPPLHIDHATTTNSNHVVDVNTIINAQLSSSMAPHFNHYYNVMESYGGDHIGIMNNNDDDVKPNPNLLMSLDQWHHQLPPNSSYHDHAYEAAGKLHPLFPYFNINNAALGLGSSCSTTYYGSSTPNSFL